MAFDPWFKTTLPLNALDSRLRLRVPHDVFSTQRIDEGTLLLLEHLGTSTPRRILDMGCGYGALGLPIAAKQKESTVEMVDRDLLAVSYAARNARENGLANAKVHGSLGFRDLEPGGAPYDQILCNVPARIGKGFIEHLLGYGRTLLSKGGEIRIVVIRDLCPVVEEIGKERSWPIELDGRGPRHAVYALAAEENPVRLPLPSDEALYGRDEVELGGLRFVRPHDLGGDDPKRLKSGLPVLLDALPRQSPKTVLCWRYGYGIVPLTGLHRWPTAKVVAVERDLLATTFTRINARRHGVTDRLEIREAAHMPEALNPDERFDLILGELSPSAAEKVAEDELLKIAGSLAKGGQALVLALEKLEREWVGEIASRRKLAINRFIAREGYCLLRLTA